ncbi:MAG: hypothetical protein RR235_07940 [Oscillospiraceae bacterium]
MKYGLSIREYKGLYTLEYRTPSVGMTLLATWDKAQADAEMSRLKRMTAVANPGTRRNKKC